MRQVLHALQPMNDGARLLRRTGLSFAEIGRRVKRSRFAVCRWCAEGRKPDFASRMALRAAFGIEPEAFDRVTLDVATCQQGPC